MKHIESYIKEFLTKYDCDEKPLFAGVSGGADSMALLTALHNLGLHPNVLHVNFHLRGEESNEDQHFVETFCKEHGVAYRIHECNTYEYASQHGVSIEMAARDIRYDWFAKECGENGILLIAHNADDVAETILLNQIRGTGILGLCGIREKSGNILRPLLQFSHKELLEYLESNSIPHCEDSTNSQNIAKRNTLRNSVFPILKKINPAVTETLCKNAIRMQGIEAIYRRAIQSAIKAILSAPICELGISCTEIKMDIVRLMSEASPITIAYEILAPLGFNEEQIGSFMELCRERNPGKQLTAPRYRILFERNGVYITQNTPTKVSGITIESEQELQHSITTAIGALEFHIHNGSITTNEIIKESTHAYFDLDKIKFPLVIRNIQNGDRIKPFGMKGRSKLVSDLMNDAKINSYEREKIPLLCDSNGIMWVIGLRACEELKVTSQTQRVLIIKTLCP